MRLLLWKKITLAVLLLTVGCHLASAQFYQTGDDPASFKWRQMETERFRMIFPEGTDSVARVYARELEAAAVPVSMSVGYEIGSVWKRKLPVILHPACPYSNGSVTLAPGRMDLFTLPDAYAPTPIPWHRSLALHEGRHASQLQFTADRKFKVFKWLTGEMIPGGISGVYSSLPMLEGDAVVAETALSASGRGRQASFLNYMMPAFDSGDWRDWWQWTHGSLKKFTPDYYKGGYMLVSGTRAFFDDPLFSQRFYNSASGKLRCFNMQKTVKEASGMKFKKSFRTIQENWKDIWNAEALQRAPFMEEQAVTAPSRIHSEYKGGTATPDGSIYLIRTSLSEPAVLTRISPDGKEETLRTFSLGTGRLAADPSGKRVWWTEMQLDKRWNLGGCSAVCYIDADEPRKIHTLTKDGRFFNCAPAPDGHCLSVTEYPISKPSRLTLLDPENGNAIKHFNSPDSLQFTESAWIGERLFAAGISDKGAGIYEILKDESSLRMIASPQPVELSCLSAWPEGNFLSFVSDHDGVSEMYRIDVDSGDLVQVTSTRYGLSFPFFNAAGDILYYTSVAASEDPSSHIHGSMLYSTEAANLPMRNADYSKIHSYPVADALSRQERELSNDNCGKPADDVKISEPRRYSKLRLPHLHSWAPIYFNSSSTMDLSMEEIVNEASIGATAIFQNLLSTGYGFAGYSFHKDSQNEWRHSLHFNYVYSGLHPVFDFNLDFGDRDRMTVRRMVINDKDDKFYITHGTLEDGTNNISASLKTYIPLNFSSGGISRGIIPMLNVSFSNDRWYNDVFLMKVEETEEGSMLVQTGFLGSKSDALMTTADLVIRGYAIRNKGQSKTFPSLGIGVEAGVRTRPGHASSFKSTAYAYAYGYLPGLTPLQGLKLTAGMEKGFGKSDYSFPDPKLPRPRGFVNSGLSQMLGLASSSRISLSADYSIPFLDVSRAFLGPVAYVRNFEIIPFADWSYSSYSSMPELMINPSGINGEQFASVGADLTVHLGNFLWLPYDSTFGIRFARNFWQNLQNMSVGNLEKTYIGLLFSMDL